MRSTSLRDSYILRVPLCREERDKHGAPNFAASFVYREQPVLDTLLPLLSPALRISLASGHLVEERLLLFPTPKDAALFFFPPAEHK
jgi:hypothetical protein